MTLQTGSFKRSTMTRSVLIVTSVVLTFVFLVPPLSAMEAVSGADSRDPQQITENASVSDIPYSDSASCAMDLQPDAKEIYLAVAPKVTKDSKLRKLVKKDVKPKVFSGQLSIKAARKNSKAASICLKLLKMGH